jgi:hypothetical protein
MIGKNKELPDVNAIATTTALFVEYYNENIPEAFPRATLKALEKFKIAHPVLFKESSEWTIDRHRKKLMDWLASYREEEK